MKIDNHPDIKWPPTMSGSYRGAQKFPLAGVDGILKAVRTVKDTRRPPVDPDCIKMTVEYDGHEFSGLLIVRNPGLTDPLCQQLARNCIGMLMSDVGAIDVP